ncbi:rRNA methyltransferase 3, mitochondrial isoform X2 [Ptiloglossa arizonensis]|uniref:rRNA methyltransferase 3, mitochondrial isoform X2 n=1 Tax=Ptiloglossa arizonensis TaxID=3350558 RepID=UPI003F9F0633
MIFSNIVHRTFYPLQCLRNLQTIDIKLNVTRTYTRWSSRKPVAIVNEDELFDTEDTTKEKIIQSNKTFPEKSRKRKPLRASKNTPTTKKISGYMVLEKNDKIASSLMTQIKTRKRREKNGQIVLEGYRLIKDALEAGVVLTTILFNNPSDIESLKLSENVKLLKVPYKTIQLWSNLTSPSGLIGIFETPDISNVSINESIPLTIICDNVRDPGNLGSIIRAAAGVGCEKLILIKGCVDPWNPKVVRSAAGAHFRLPIHSFPLWDEIPSLISEDSNIFLADSNFGNDFKGKYSNNIPKTSTSMFNINPEKIKANINIDDSKMNEKKNVSSIIPTNKQLVEL